MALDHILGGSDSELLITKTYKDVIDEWIFDAGVTYHISPACKKFSSYRDVGGGTLMMVVMLL